MYAVSLIILGILLLITGILLRSYVFMRELSAFGTVMRENTTIDKDNPPKVIMRKNTDGGTIFINVHGTARYTPREEFVSYEDTLKEAQKKLRYVKSTSMISILLGVALIISYCAALPF